MKSSLALWAFVLCVSIAYHPQLEAQNQSDAELSARGARLRNEAIRSAPEDFFNSLTYPTAPIRLGRLYAEWEPSAALLVSIPIKSFLNEPPIASFYTDFLREAIEYVPIAISYDAANTRYLPLFEEMLLSDETLKKHAARIHLAETRTGSYWIRDFGPLYGFSRKGELVVIDTVYRSLEGEVESYANSPVNLDSKDIAYDFEEFVTYRQGARKDDVSPLFLTKFLRQKLGIPCDTVRPPLGLQGGDYMTDGAGNVFMSEDTIMANGGRKGYVERIIEDYFGGAKLHILNPPPGTAAKHLDLLLKPLSPNIILYAEPPLPRAGSTVFNRRLSKEFKSLQEINLDYLRRHFPETELIGLPTPPILEDSAEEILSAIRLQLKVALCEALGVNFLRYVRMSPEEPDRQSVDRMIARRLAEIAGRPLDMKVREDLDAACRSFLNSTLDALEHYYVGSTTVYRSYTNSIIIKNAEGKMGIFIPRYLPLAGESAATFQETEAQVAEAYLKAYPDAKIHWIDSDHMAKKLGALHCLSSTIPATP